MASPRNRLPTLFEVLSRRTQTPVDLFSFYIYMRDQQRSVDYLDFWLDVAQHMSLCRHYVRELRRSVLVSTPDLNKNGSNRSSAIAEEEGGDERNADQRLSAYLRAENVPQFDNNEASQSNPAERAGPAERSQNRVSYIMSNSPEAMGDSPGHTVSRADIRASAEKILYTYLLSGSEREIVLPQPILQAVTNDIETMGRDDPEVFDEAKDYVFQAMERDAFRNFLRMKALGNLIPPSRLLRLIVGLLCVFGGFWTAFCLIFLDITPKITRLWLILPFFFGIYFLMAHQYALDPIMALVGLSEYTWMKFMRIREPYVRKLLVQRAIWLLIVDLFLVTVLLVIFSVVPGHRL